MRRSRIGGNRYLMQRIYFVVIALAFVGSGYLIGRYFLASLLQKAPTGQPVITPDQGGHDPSDIVTAQLNTPSLTVYRVQIGAFSNKETADKLAVATVSQGVAAYSMAPDPLFKVFCGVCGKKEIAEKIAEDITPKLAGTVIGREEKPYVGTMDIPSYTFTVQGPKSQVDVMESSLSKYSNALFSLIEFWDGLLAKEPSSVDLSSMEQDLGDMKNALSGFTPTMELSATHEEMLTLINQLNGAVSAAKDASGGNGRIAQGMVSFMEVLDSFVTTSEALSD